jgi:tetratricopeptide (TPR) repeat protein
MAVKTKVDDKRDWLVKAAARIMGPFSFKEIVDQLREQTVNPADEARRCDRRWMSLREFNEFIPVIQSLKFERETSELTVTTASATGTSTKTERISSESQGDVTPPPQGPPLPPTPSNRSEGSGNGNSPRQKMKDVTPVREASFPNRPAHLTGKAFGLHNDLRLEREIEVKANSWRWLMLGLIILIIGGVGGVQVYQAQKKTSEFTNGIQAALRYKSLQLYEQALNEFKKASLIRPPDFSVQAQMATLLIAVDGETVKGRRILEKAISTPGRSRTQMADDYTGIGLALLIQGEYKESEEALAKALSFDRGHLAANINLAWIHYTKKSYQEALRVLGNIQMTGQPILALAEAIVAYEATTRLKMTGLVASSMLHLESSIRGSQNLKAEQILMLITLMRFQGGDEDLIWMKRYLDEPKRSQAYFVQDPLITRRWIEGPHWERFCTEFLRDRPSTSLMRMTRAACLMNIGKENEARRIVDEAFKQNPKDPFVLLLQVNLFARSNRASEAQTLAQAPELKEFRNPNWITGKMCLDSRDLSCAQSSFRAILEKNPADIYARGGLAATQYQMNQKVDALKTISIGLNDEPFFLPLLELRDVVETQ